MGHCRAALGPSGGTPPCGNGVMATDRSGGRRRRWCVGVLVALLAVPASARSAPVEEQAVAWHNPSAGYSVAGGFDDLTARLRVPESDALDGGSTATAGGEVPGELAIAPPARFESEELASTVLAPPPRVLHASRYDASVA